MDDLVLALVAPLGAAALAEAACLVHATGGPEEGVVRRGHTRPVEPAGPEDPQDLNDLLRAVASLSVGRQDTIVTDDADVWALTGIIRDQPHDVTVYGSDKCADADRVGIFENVAVEFPETILKGRTQQAGVTPCQDGVDGAGLISGGGVEEETRCHEIRSGIGE
jgi:hypothetical protein